MSVRAYVDQLSDRDFWKRTAATIHAATSLLELSTRFGSASLIHNSPRGRLMALCGAPGMSKTSDLQIGHLRCRLTYAYVAGLRSTESPAIARMIRLGKRSRQWPAAVSVPID